MKKFTLTLATIFLAATVFAGNDNNGNAGSDSNEATHKIGITIPDVALVDVESEDNNLDITLQPSVEALEAGSAVDFSNVKDESLWLNYTSIVQDKNKKRKITAKLSGEELPEGITIQLTASSRSASGKGTTGSGKTQTLSSKEAKDIVTGIGSCYTESGAKKGHQLTYKMSVDNDQYADFLAKSYNIDVLFTITD